MGPALGLKERLLSQHLIGGRGHGQHRDFRLLKYYTLTRDDPKNISIKYHIYQQEFRENENKKY